MAVAYATSTLDVSLNSVGVTNMTLPSGSAVGDIVFVFSSFYGNSSEEYDFTGLTMMDVKVSFDSGSNRFAYSGYKVLDSTDISNGYLVASSSDGFSSVGRAHLIRVTGGSTVGLVHDDSVDTDSDTSKVFGNTVTPAGADSLILFYVAAGMNGSISAQAITTDNPSWTELSDSAFNSGANYVTHAIAYASRTAVTATGDSSCTLSTNSRAFGVIVAIQPQLDVTVTGSTGSAVLNGNSGTVTGSANVTGSTGSIVLNGNTGTLNTPDPDWFNDDKSAPTPSEFANTPKS